MSYEQYNTQTNPFSALQKAAGNIGAGRANLAHALIVNQAHHQNVMEQLQKAHELTESGRAAERSHELETLGRTQEFQREQSRKTRSHEVRLANIDVAKTRMMTEADAAKQAAAHAHEITKATQAASIQEAVAAATHSRNKELFAGVQRGSAPGTEVSFGVGDFKAKFTKATPKKRAPKPQPAAAPTQESAPTAKPSGPSVGRDPLTGKAVSLKKKK